MKKRTLLAITAANQLSYTQACLKSFDFDKEGVDVIVMDDASIDETRDYCLKNDIRIESTRKSKGLTYQWNKAYKIFKEEDFDNLILANNDILIPAGSVPQLVKCLELYILCGVVGSKIGVGHQPKQNIDNYIKLASDNYDPTHYEKVQNELLESNISETIELDFINGFFFGFRKDISKYEFDKDVLFNPTNINVANEDDLCARVSEPIGVSLKSFIFHFKGVSFSNVINGYDFGRELTWYEAERLRKSKTLRFWTRLKNRFK